MLTRLMSAIALTIALGMSLPVAAKPFSLSDKTAGFSAKFPGKPEYDDFGTGENCFEDEPCRITESKYQEENPKGRCSFSVKVVDFFDDPNQMIQMSSYADEVLNKIIPLIVKGTVLSDVDVSRDDYIGRELSTKYETSFLEDKWVFFTNHKIIWHNHKLYAVEAWCHEGAVNAAKQRAFIASFRLLK